jgi:hypothetical protein
LSAPEIQQKIDDMIVQVIANIEWLGDKWTNLDRKDEKIQAELREITKQLGKLPESLEQKIISRLVKLGWGESKAKRGVRAVSTAAAKNGD